MKWIGQNIYDFISRFRNDVYLESISTGTIASGAHLGLDSNNKIVKAVDGGGDLTSIVAGTGLSGTSLTGPIPTLNVDASQTQITSIGTIGTGTWQGSVIANAYLDADTAHLTGAQTFTGAKTFASGIILDGDRSVIPRDGTAIHVDTTTITDSGTSASGTAANNHTVTIEAQTLAAANSSVTNTHAASLFVGNAPSAGTNMTLTNAYSIYAPLGLVRFGGALTVGGTITGDVTGDLTGTVITATQPNIDSIGTDGDTLNILSDQLLMSNTSADTPVIKLVNTTDDDQAGQLIFEKLRDDDAVAVGQNLGEIWFRGQDAAQNTEDYAFIVGEIDVSTSGQESGKLVLGVAAHDGSNRTAMTLTGGSAATEVDATIGLGVNSVVTIPGNIDLAGDIDVDGTLETDALTIGGATIAAIGTTGITTLGTIGTGVWNGTAIAADQQKHLMHYQVQGYSAGSTNYVASKNIASNTAPFKHDVDIGSDGTTAKSVTVWMRTGGHVMPNACTLTRFTGWTETAGSGTSYIGLFRVRLADDSDTDPSAELLQEVTYTASGNQIANLFNVTDASGEQSLDLAAGDIIFPAIKGAGNPTYFNATFEVEF